MTTPERGLHCSLSQNHLSCLCKRDSCDSYARSSHLICCSVAYRRHVYIVDRLFGSMLMDGSGRTAHLICCSVAYRRHVYIVDRLFGSMLMDGSGRTAHLICCSVAYRRHEYIVDRLFGSMLMDGSVRTAHFLYAEVNLCILLIYPVQPGRGRVICKHSKNFFNEDVSCIINKGMHGK